MWPLFLDPAAAHDANRLSGSGEPASAFHGEESFLRLRDIVSQSLDFRLEESLRRAIGIAIGFEGGNRLGAFSGEGLVASPQSRRDAQL